MNEKGQSSAQNVLGNLRTLLPGTVAHWNDKGEIIEENLFYDLMGMVRQIGVM